MISLPRVTITVSDKPSPCCPYYADIGLQRLLYFIMGRICITVNLLIDIVFWVLYIFWTTLGTVLVFKIVINLVNYLESCYRKYDFVLIEFKNQKWCFCFSLTKNACILKGILKDA